MTNIYHGFELLLFKKFSCHPEVWYGLRKQIQDKLEKSSDDVIDINDIVQVIKHTFKLHAVSFKKT